MLNLLRKSDDLSQQATIWYVPLPKLEDNPYQTRQRNDVDHVLNLAASIVQMAPSLPDTKGLQQLPIGRLVRYADGYAYPPDVYEDGDAVRDLLAGGDVVVELAFGHSRRLAFEVLANGVMHVFKDIRTERAVEWRQSIGYDAADYAAMPVQLRPLSDQEMWSHAITENAQRRDLTAIEEAISIERARRDFGMTYDQAGRLFGKSRGAAANLVRLLKLPDAYQQAILDGELSERHGRALLAAVAYPTVLDRYSVERAAAMSVADLEQGIGYWVRTHETYLADQAEKQKPVLFVNELAALIKRFLAEQWGDRDLPENPAHTNGTLWQEITRWLATERDGHRWDDGDLKSAIREQVNAQRAQLARAVVVQSPSVAGAPASATPESTASFPPSEIATDDQVAGAFAAWLRESAPTLDQLMALDVQWTFAPLWWPMLTSLKAQCGGAGILDNMLHELISNEIARRQEAMPPAQSQPMMAVFAQEMELDRDRLAAWRATLEQALDAIGQWTLEFGHPAEAGAAARAVRVVVEMMEAN